MYRIQILLPLQSNFLKLIFDMILTVLCLHKIIGRNTIQLVINIFNKVLNTLLRLEQTGLNRLYALKTCVCK